MYFGDKMVSAKDNGLSLGKGRERVGGTCNAKLYALNRMFITISLQFRFSGQENL